MKLTSVSYFTTVIFALGANAGSMLGLRDVVGVVKMARHLPDLHEGAVFLSRFQECCQRCVLRYGGSPCPITKVACYCEDFDFLYSQAQCLKTQCSTEDIQKCWASFTTTCKPYWGDKYAA